MYTKKKRQSGEFVGANHFVSSRFGFNDQNKHCTHTHTHTLKQSIVQFLLFFVYTNGQSFNKVSARFSFGRVFFSWTARQIGMI